MSSRIAKLAGVALLAAPFVLVLNLGSAHADDCAQPYGGHIGGNASDATCNDVGMHMKIPAKAYTVRAQIDPSGLSLGGNTLTGMCNGARLSEDAISSGKYAIPGSAFADTAESVTQAGAALILGVADPSGRNVGYLIAWTDNKPHTATVTCRDDRKPYRS